MGASARGHQRERDLVNALRPAGWLAWRAPASLGVCDVIAARAGFGLHLIEVKSTGRGPFAGFPPASRAALVEAADLAGATAWLWWNGPGRSAPGFWPVSRWPGVEGARAGEGFEVGTDLVEAGRLAGLWA